MNRLGRVLSIFSVTTQSCTRLPVQCSFVRGSQAVILRNRTQWEGHRFSTQASLPEQSEEEDELFIKIDIEVKGHDEAVLKSYRKFVDMAGKGLDLEITDETPPARVIKRLALLKSAFVHKKHWVHYESRTHYKTFRLHRLTGSTASTFLEYIQRNLPEGVAMKVTTHKLERLPEDIQYSIQELEGTNVDSPVVKDIHNNPKTLFSSASLQSEAKKDGLQSSNVDDVDVENDITSSDSSDSDSSDDDSSDEETEEKPKSK